ncbi:hypothetical protein [Acinetobacter radioresistens]|uniref:hypothetical protein n=1 Tax=Acinetobacter radioresistens TaxID=40216 RepID=UPI0035CCEFB1
MKKIILAALFLFPVLVMAKGGAYSNTEWGMSPEQVVAVEKDRAELIEPKNYSNGWGKVEIKNIKVGGNDYLVTFIFDDANQLVQTTMSSIEKKNVGIISLQYDELSKLLTQKYGAPQFRSLDTVTWKTNKTTIELSKVIIRSISFAQVFVRYMPNSRVNDDTSNL